MNKKGNITTADSIEWNRIQSMINQLLKEEETTNNNLNVLFLITIGAYTGLRFSELCNLKFSDFEKNDHKVFERKTKKTRKISWNAKIIEVVSFIKKYKSGNVDFILTNKNGGQLSIQYSIYLLKKICIENNVSGSISVHSLRKTFGRRIYTTNNQSEHALVLLSDIFGHSSLKITRIYLGIREEEKQSIYLGL